MRYVLTILTIFYLCPHALATWSIMIVNPKTGEVGIAGASCTPNCSGIGKLVPGKGAIIVQAMSNAEARRKGVELIGSDYSPDAIIAALRNTAFDPEYQQYAVITLSHAAAPATYTGTEVHLQKGAITLHGVSIQGNTLVSEDELEAIRLAVLKSQQNNVSTEEILMLALEAGATTGGDRRCGEQRATSALITMAKPTDKLNRPYLFLEFFGQKKGGMNAVTLLRGKYEKWKKKHQTT